MARKAASIWEPLKSLVRSRRLRRARCRQRASSSRSGLNNDVEAAGAQGRKLQHEALHSMVFRNWSILSQASDTTDIESDDEVSDSDNDNSRKTSPSTVLRERRANIDARVDACVKEYLAGLTAEQQQEREENQKQSMNLLVESDTLGRFKELLSVFVDDDWQPTYIDGNMYRMAAFGAFERDNFDVTKRGWLPWAKFVMVSLGLVVIFLIQLFAPMLYFLSSVLGFGIEEDDYIHLSKLGDPDVPSIRKELVDNWVSKLFGFLFLIVFLINGIAVMIKEREDWQKLDRIVHFFHRVSRLRFYKGWMRLGCFINCWVACWCALDVWVVLAGADSPQEVIFDSLSLLFLYNLDDIGGELGFFQDIDWQGTELSWVYQRMQIYLEEEEKQAESEGRIPNLTKYELMNYYSKFASSLYYTAIAFLACCLVVLPILFFTIPVLSLTGEQAGEPQ